MSKTVTMRVNRSHGGNPEIEICDRDHTPWNKRAGQVHESVAIMTVERCEPKGSAGNWSSVRLEEITTLEKGGRTQSRTISIYIPNDIAESLANLLAGKMVPPPTRKL